MRNPILGPSDLPIIGENRCSRKWANKREGTKIETQQGFKIALNRELSTKVI